MIYILRLLFLLFTFSFEHFAAKPTEAYVEIYFSGRSWMVSMYCLNHDTNQLVLISFEQFF